MAKTILIMVDACGFQTAKECMGFAEHMTENSQCAKYKVKAQLPSMSRVNYETLMTGQAPYKHGILSNLVVRRSLCENLFSIAKKNALSTAAAAYMWISELYSKAPFSPYEDRIQLDKPAGDIDHGIFYFEDPYPDTHLYSDAEYLRKTYHPDFMLVHPMGMDNKGHIATSDSRGYREACVVSDIMISLLLPAWRAEGYDVIITGDHGMDNFGLHGGDTELQRTVPLYIFSDKVKKGDFSLEPISQLNIAPLACMLLGVTPSEQMVSLDELHLV